MVVCAGSTLIDCIVTESGSKDVADEISLSPGGEAFNEAIWLSSLGENVTICSAIGDDFAGKQLKGLLNSIGIRIGTGFSGKTPVSILTVNENGERKSRVSKAHALPGFSPSVPDLQNISFITMASLFRAPFLDPEQCYKFAVQAGKIPGIKLLADTKLPKGGSLELKDYADTLQLLDYITPNEQEARYYTGKASPKAAAEVFHSFGVKNVIVKCGPEGCFVLPEHGEPFRFPACRVECVDGIGAGDAFNAGLVYQLIRSASLYDAVLFATACAGLSVTKRGAVSAAAGARRVYSFMDEFLLTKNPEY